MQGQHWDTEQLLGSVLHRTVCKFTDCTSLSLSLSLASLPIYCSHVFVNDICWFSDLLLRLACCHLRVNNEYTGCDWYVGYCLCFRVTQIRPSGMFWFALNSEGMNQSFCAIPWTGVGWGGCRNWSRWERPMLFVLFANGTRSWTPYFVIRSFCS
jgi:hypothetical protein